MKGTERICNIVAGAYRFQLGERIATNEYRGTAVRFGSVVLVKDRHARGNTCRIVLENGNDRLEIYGELPEIGQRGWTEEYGWLAHGNWDYHVDNLLNQIETEVCNENLALEKKAEEAKRKQRELELQNIERFNSMFYS